MVDLHKYELPIAQALSADYIEGKQQVIETLYGYYAGNTEDWIKRSTRLTQLQHTRVESSSLANVLKAYNERLSASEETLANIDHIAHGAKVVIGGQQAGIWTGPLLVVHKAVSVIQAALSASEQLQEKVVPVFWIAGEDHDWDEVNHTYLISTEQQLKKLSINRDASLRTSVSRTSISTEQWQEALEELSQQLPGSEFKEQLILDLQLMGEKSTSLSDFFGNMLSALFAKYGLVLIDSDDPQVREIESSMFNKLLKRNDELEQAYLQSAQAVRDLGYSLQADVTVNSANLFLFVEESQNDRVLLYKENGEFRDRKNQYHWTMQQLEELLENKPQSFSNNVLTRPLMQDYLFPVLATVLGPGEISYWGLTKQAFEVLGMEMPIIVPRMSYTLVEGIIAKNMTKYELSFADVMDHFQERKQQWLHDQDELHVADQFKHVREQFTAMYAPLIELAGSIQSGLSKLGDTNMNKIIEQMTYMEAKTVDAQQKQFEAAIRQLDRVELSLKPSGKPQERVLSMISYWNRYDKAWLDAIFAVTYCRTGGHEIVYL
ncbi:bacillithiol biosynthesis cysteine-adding enzyme BshC [Paenibacillus endoradicis]|uniref:bacillithiol biosynthesis cysteine-adding enzyme BshC n=1 Tax=Paenibacillus endoradicis TaxID=2972487 RepID=UPI0021597C75|nr:bacillithiol biosynthesis cysteine-adding enzyme BshC [Paenibacillus endoradicis]MCR8655991.1 bacillithiol biosynthesis cysteine-adding enzyme BshC [Paenibacillus endoradicis]MCR8658317.1 bacillithiol biosynthesis cysteine-adding enzyme BshC [Paenibacillus endoradicis]